MLKTTQRELRELVKSGQAVDVSGYGCKEASELMNKESYLSQLAYSSGVYGCNGQLFKGRETGTLYAITSRTTAIFLF